MNPLIFEYQGKIYPDYLRRGNAMQFIAPIALQYCKGNGLDMGAGQWPLPGAVPRDEKFGHNLEEIPERGLDFIFSSHCLEHLDDPVRILEHWKLRLHNRAGVLFLYLPHPSMEYWRPENCRKHRHLFYPKDVAAMLTRLGFQDVLHSERDLNWSFAVVGFNHG